MPTAPHLVRLSERLHSADIVLSPSQLERKATADVVPLDDAPEAEVLAFYRIVERFAGRGRSGDISADDLTTLEAARECIPSKRLRDVVTRLGEFEPCTCDAPDPDPSSPDFAPGSTMTLAGAEQLAEAILAEGSGDPTLNPLIKRLVGDPEAAMSALDTPEQRAAASRFGSGMVGLQGVGSLLKDAPLSDIEVDAIGAALGIDASAGLAQMLSMTLAHQLEVFAHASEQDLANAVKVSCEMIPWATAELGIDQPRPDWRLIAAGVPAILVHVESIRRSIGEGADPRYAFAILTLAMTQPDALTSPADSTTPGDPSTGDKP